jgi:hypothetical protein
MTRNVRRIALYVVLLGIGASASFAQTDSKSPKPDSPTSTFEKDNQTVQMVAPAKTADPVERVVNIATLVCTFALTVVGIIGVCFALKTLKLLVRQTALNTFAANAARTGAEAALLNAQAVINSERAWIEIDFGPPEKDSLEEENEDDFGAYSIVIKNHGRTIAQIESFQFGMDSFAGDFDPKRINCTTKNFNRLLGSDDKPTPVTTINIPARFSDQEWEQIRTDATRALVRR